MNIKYSASSFFFFLSQLDEYVRLSEMNDLFKKH